MNGNHLRRTLAGGWILAAALWASAPPARAQSAPAGQPIAAQLATLRAQVQQFQALINRELQTALDHPFGMLQDPKGIYLPHFGVVFHMELNLAPMRMMTMFDTRPYTEEELQQTRQTKLQRIREMESHLSELLREHGAELSAVPPDQNVAVVVHLFNMPSERTDGLPTQIVVEVSRGVLADPQTRVSSLEEFRKQVRVFDF
jgi:hypothetical protein